ncbi:hypothetical protein IF1G_02356 [Cordyceps javanica]|uniref:Secreted protein n=1 Tax=Cordyceps javanica TaxID=43265 RepID=A0A545V970_9HYPO|nr:hypothetical protein IF1G_02356 [Cordyceps javanica]
MLYLLSTLLSCLAPLVEFHLAVTRDYHFDFISAVQSDVSRRRDQAVDIVTVVVVVALGRSSLLVEACLSGGQANFRQPLVRAQNSLILKAVEIFVASHYLHRLPSSSCSPLRLAPALATSFP